MLEWWRDYVDLGGVLIVAGGSRGDFEAIAHPQKVFVDDPHLHTVDHQREFQSYSGVFAAVAGWLTGREYTHISFCEYDHLPLVADFNERQCERLVAQDADVIGCQVHRVDGTNHPHYLYHHSNPEFHRFWENITRRPDPEVVLSMFGSGSFWTREAFDAVASGEEPFRIYLEIYLPTLAHHLGFRVRDLPDQNPFVQVAPDLGANLAAVRAAGAWSAHPVKDRWTRGAPPASASVVPRGPRGRNSVRRVMWLPAHPSAGSVSMLRHWRELDAVVRTHPDPRFEVTCPLGLPPGLVRPAGRLTRAWEKYRAYPRLLEQAGEVDVVHILDHAFAHLLEAAPRGAKKIVTVHDLAPLEDGSLTPAQERRFRKTLSWMKRADLLLCDSEFTARTVRAFIGGGVQVEVLLLGVNTDAFAERHDLPSRLTPPPAPRLLSIGSCLARKNLHALPQILKHVIREIGPVSLLRVGDALPAALRTELDELFLPGRFVEYGCASDEDVIAIYQTSDLLVFPSTLEGFGLPLVEAMAAGCAVVTSRASSLPEVGGDAVLYFDPRDPDEAAARIVEVLRQPALHETLLHLGRQRARELSWEKHWKKLAEFYA